MKTFWNFYKSIQAVTRNYQSSLIDLIGKNLSIIGQGLLVAIHTHANRIAGLFSNVQFFAISYVEFSQSDHSTHKSHVRYRNSTY